MSYLVLIFTVPDRVLLKVPVRGERERGGRPTYNFESLRTMTSEIIGPRVILTPSVSLGLSLGVEMGNDSLSRKPPNAPTFFFFPLNLKYIHSLFESKVIRLLYSFN